MHQRFLFIAVAAFSLLRAAPVQQAADAREVFFVAATPAQFDEPKSYPATLYAKGQGTRLRVVQSLFGQSRQFSSIADDLHGTIYLAGPDGVYVVHEDNPSLEDFVPITNFDNSTCWGAVMVNEVHSALQYCSDKVYRVQGTATAGTPRVAEGDWTAFKALQFGGENGGPFQMTPPLAEIANNQLVMPDAADPKASLAELPAAMASKPEARRLVRIVASNDRYLAIWVPPASMVGQTVDASNPEHAEPLKINVLNRATREWKTMEVATTVTSITEVPVRIFGDWIATVEMKWKPGAPGTGSGSPGMQNERTVPEDSPQPDIRDRYYNRFLDVYIPGRLVLKNLADGRTVVMDIGQQDCEVLAVRSDGTMLYRVNDAVFSTVIDGEHASVGTLLVKDSEVPDIHWAFWGPANKH